MKIIHKCTECGETLSVSALSITPEGVPTFGVSPHECFPESDEPRGVDAMFTASPTRGSTGLVPNPCMVCGEETEKIGENKHGQDEFICLNSGCMVEFVETGTVPELLPARFEEGIEYSITLNDGLAFDFTVIRVIPSCVYISAKCDFPNMQMLAFEEGYSEFMRAPKCVSDKGEKIYPYCRKSQKKEQKKEIT